MHAPSFRKLQRPLSSNSALAPITCQVASAAKAKATLSPHHSGEGVPSSPSLSLMEMGLQLQLLLLQLLLLQLLWLLLLWLLLLFRRTTRRSNLQLRQASYN